MKKILLIPLDERPCNYDYPLSLLKETGYELIMPPRSLLGNKKEAGDLDAIYSWVFDHIRECAYAVLSIDTLLYSGIVPSRLHHFEKKELLLKLSGLKKLKELNPEVKIYGFSLIMRNPQYSSSEEEPDYYGTWGKEIHLYGAFTHKCELGIATQAERDELEDIINNRLPPRHLEDYLSRREKNIAANIKAVDLVKEGILDFLIIPQDDSSPYGLTAKDQQILRKHIRESGIITKVYMYPDADAVANTLLARCINDHKDIRPLFYVKYASGTGGAVIPLFEDRPVSESIKYQILAAGGLMVSSAYEADILLLVNVPGSGMKDHMTMDTALSQTIEYDSYRTLIELAEYAGYAIDSLKKKVAVADIAYANGGDPVLFDILREKGLLFRLSGYAGWNTSSNTLGTCIPMSIIHMVCGAEKEHLKFLMARYIEDIGYCVYVRRYVADHIIGPMSLRPDSLDGPRGQVSRVIREKLQEFADHFLDNEAYQIVITDSFQPWNRLFETGISVDYHKKGIT